MGIQIEKRETAASHRGYPSHAFYGQIKLKHQKKPRGFYGSTEAEVNSRIDAYLAQETEIHDKKAEARKAAAQQRSIQNGEAAKLVKPGDIFVSSWGYDQTNVDFYQVISVQGKIAEVREIAHEVKSHEGTGYSDMSGKAIPVKDAFKGEPMKKLIQGGYKGEPGFKVASYAAAHKWDGNPAYVSWYA